MTALATWRRFTLFCSLIGLGFACQSSAPQYELECKTIAVLPPENLDEVASEYISNLWAKELRRRKMLVNCDKVISSERLRSIYFPLNITHRSKLSGPGLTLAQRRTLINRSGITHVAALGYRYAKGRLTFKPQLYDIVLQRQERDHAVNRELAVNKVDQKYFELDGSKRFKLAFTHFLPTALSMGATNSNFGNAYTEESAKQRYVQLGNKRKSLVPPLLSSFRLENIPNRSGYNLFDGSLRLVPYLNVTVVDNLYEYVDINQYYESQTNAAAAYDPFQYSLVFYGFSPNLLLEGSFYTPIGTFFLAFGGGPAMYYYADSEGAGSFGMKLSRAFRIGYRIFLTESWFMQAAVEDQDYSRAVSNEYYQSTSDTYAILGIGYLYPEIQRMIRDTLL